MIGRYAKKKVTISAEFLVFIHYTKDTTDGQAVCITIFNVVLEENRFAANIASICSAGIDSLAGMLEGSLILNITFISIIFMLIMVRKV